MRDIYANAVLRIRLMIDEWDFPSFELKYNIEVNSIVYKCFTIYFFYLYMRI